MVSPNSILQVPARDYNFESAFVRLGSKARLVLLGRTTDMNIAMR